MDQDKLDMIAKAAARLQSCNISEIRQLSDVAIERYMSDLMFLVDQRSLACESGIYELLAHVTVPIGSEWYFRQGREERQEKRRKNRANPKFGYVYLLSCSLGYYKIGHTNDPDRRFRDFEVKLPFGVQIECLIESQNRYQLEADLHRRFRHCRVNGEWFKLDREDVSCIFDLAEGTS